MTRPGPLTGSIMGNYTLADLLDEGGVGSVYVAEHRFLGEKAAVKVLQQQPLNSNAEDVARRFFQEARATRSIDHPNVLKVLDFGQTDAGTLYLAMELLDGASIAQVLRRGPRIEERSAAYIAAAVSSGLAAAHDKGIIHRDLKPANIFLCSSGRVRLLDFGMAKVKEGKLQTGVGMIAGTPQYMSPEQIRQEADIGPRADVYGLGAVLFRMLTGKLPFESESLHDIVKAHLFTTPPAPSEHAPVSPRMDAIVLACLQKDPARRPQTMLELRELLRPIAEQLGPGAAQAIVGHDRGELLPTGETARGLQELARSTVQELPSSSTMTPARSGGAGRAIALLLVVAALAAGAVVYKPWAHLSSRASPPPAPVAAPSAAPAPPAAPSTEFTLLSVQSDPPGAQVYADHVLKGAAPIDLTVSFPVEIKLTLDGYKTMRKKITHAGPVKIKLWPESSTVKLPSPPAGEDEGKLEKD